MTSVSDQKSDESRFVFSTEKGPKFTHYAFRYPAKFHPPVIRQLISQYSVPGDLCLDPFNGSGTTLVEASVQGRHSVGFDVDPVAIFVSSVKSKILDVDDLNKSIAPVLSKVEDLYETHPRISKMLSADIGPRVFSKIVKHENLLLPAIPKLHHWFRNTMIVQLARIKQIIRSENLAKEYEDFLMLCFAGSIRSCSNADPTPVSGLEVTSHMLRLEEEGREIDAIAIFLKKVRATIKGAREYADAINTPVTARSVLQDARKIQSGKYRADVIITSPPYHSAVDYYRRHQLEMFWLELTKSNSTRQALIPSYIGRAKVPKKNHPEVYPKMGRFSSECERYMRSLSESRADDFLHYYWSMSEVFGCMSGAMKENGKCVFVVGNSQFRGKEIPTPEIFAELARPHFNLVDVQWYPIKNRYMSYARHNGADINREYVLTFEQGRLV